MAVIQDFVSAVRRLRRAPGVSAAVVLSIALGIGANTAIFGVARAILFEPIPYRHADRVVDVELMLRGQPMSMSAEQAGTLQRLARSLERVEGSARERMDWRRGDSTVRLSVSRVTPDLPDAMGMTPLVGRLLTASDASPGSDAVALISEGLWRRELAGTPDVVGRPIVLGDLRRTIVGVSRPPASEPEVEVWVPQRFGPGERWRPSVVAWLRPGVSPEQARAEIAGLSDGLDTDRVGPLDARLSRPRERSRASRIGRTTMVFWGASGFVLAIVCANLANLLLARNLSGQREIVIRAALGASRSRIVRLLIAESLVLGAVGGLAGVLVAVWSTAALLAIRPLSLSLVYPGEVVVDATLIAYSLGLALASGLVVGVVPALRAARGSLTSGIGRDDPHVNRGLPARWLFGGAVALQSGLALVLLVGAGLMVTNYLRLRDVGPGFDADHLVEVGVQLERSAHPDQGVRREFFRRLVEGVSTVPGVREAALATDMPPHDVVMMGAIETDGHPAETLPPVDASWVHVSPNYFRVLRVPILEGSTVPDSGGPTDQVVVSESFARRYWPQQSAVGQRFRLRPQEEWRPWMAVAGVAGDVAGRGLRDDIDEIYLPYAAGRADRGTVVARVDGDTSRVLPLLKAQVWAVDPNVPVAGLGTIRQALARSIDEQPFYAMLLGTFAAIALALAAVGVFGVTSYAASQRRREIGIRLAIGARAGEVERLVLVQGLVPAVAGIAAGLAAARALATIMQSIMHSVSATDPAIYLGTAVALASVALVATWLPARRASRLDPIAVLRHE